MVNMRIPKLADLETMIDVYHNNVELFTKDMQRIFPDAGRGTISRLKKAVQAYTIRRGLDNHFLV